MSAQTRRPGHQLGTFQSRHIGATPDEQAKMLAQIGFASIDELLTAAVPDSIRTRDRLHLPEPASEECTLAELSALAERNRVLVPMIGLGYHGTVTPAVIRRNVLEDPAWYTAYTPYQPEISQGRLEALLNFQTMIGDITGLPTANASLLDEGTAVAEAIMVMSRASKSDTVTVVLDADLLPQTQAVVRTRAYVLGIDVLVQDLAMPLPDTPFFGVVASYPGCSGEVRDLRGLAEAVHSRGAALAVATDLLALTLLVPPGEFGADVAVGTTQRFGVPLFYGGPHAAFIAVRDGLARHLPGRLVGVSVDSNGQPAYRLSLQTREQHIRRDRATSNICTAQVLLAVVAAMYAVYHGPDGLKSIAQRVHDHAEHLADRLLAEGHLVTVETFFDTLEVRTPGRAKAIVGEARERGILLRLVTPDLVGVSCSELTTDEHIEHVLEAFRVADREPGNPTTTSGLPTATAALAPATSSRALPSNLRRRSPFLTHPVFASHHSETSMLRYLRRLSDRDLALDRGMIPLGSCTMKLNATSEMEPISNTGFANLHPFAPAEDARGYADMIAQLEDWLAEVTGYAKVSVQPNAGSQGELAGLLAISSYHRANGDGDRNVCLIPASAHGTNAASAVLAGLKVVVVASNDDGTIDMSDLEAKCHEHATDLAAVMVTYPSTHGVYEQDISRLCQVVHRYGGQVYVDGANFNALLGFAKPGQFGGDVSHLNLHKTFCIPHGGGGPGVGPVAVAEHLIPHLPTHPLHPDPSSGGGIGPVSAAPFGSAGILPIPWAYIRMMGADGLLRATGSAVLAANYVARQLAPHFPILFTGQHGLVAHECIVDLRALTASTGVTVDDVAKRLVDFGFHAPTVSFPVAGTLMVEPTESEGLPEIDRFVAAMVAIRAEIDDVATGVWPVEASPLRRAPHTAGDLVKEWDRSYSVETAFFPAGLRQDKYWPPVGRIDQAHGDRNLVCSCPPVSAFEG